MMVIAQQVQDTIDNCLRFHAEYLNITQVGNSYVNRDFVGARLEPADQLALLQTYTAGVISRRRCWSNWPMVTCLVMTSRLRKNLWPRKTAG